MTRKNKTNCCSGNTVKYGELSCACFSVVCSYFFDLFPCQFVSRGVFSFPVSPPVLFGTILGIILFCSKPQVIGVDTRWIVPTRTVMAHAHAFWDMTFMDDPRCNVCANHLWVYPVKCLTSARQLSVSVNQLCCRPNPARFSLFNLVPKPLFDCFREPIKCVNGIWMRCDSPSRVDNHRSCDNIVLHNQLFWLCRAPGCFSSAGATSIISNVIG